MKCSKCQDPIDPRRIRLIPATSLCVECQSESDVFKFKMKTVGFDDRPTIARDLKSWSLLKKQKQTKDI